MDNIITTEALKKQLVNCKSRARNNGEQFMVGLSSTWGDTVISNYEIPQQFYRISGSYMVNISSLDGEGKWRSIDGYPAKWTVITEDEKKTTEERQSQQQQFPGPQQFYQQPFSFQSPQQDNTFFIQFLQMQNEHMKSQISNLTDSFKVQMETIRESLKGELQGQQSIYEARLKLSDDYIERIKSQSEEDRLSYRDMLKQAKEEAREEIKEFKENYVHEARVDGDSLFRFLETPGIQEAIPEAVKGFRDLMRRRPIDINSSEVVEVNESDSGLDGNINKWKNRFKSRK